MNRLATKLTLLICFLLASEGLFAFKWPWEKSEDKTPKSVRVVKVVPVQSKEVKSFDKPFSNISPEAMEKRPVLNQNQTTQQGKDIRIPVQAQKISEKYLIPKAPSIIPLGGRAEAIAAAGLPNKRVAVKEDSPTQPAGKVDLMNFSEAVLFNKSLSDEQKAKAVAASVKQQNQVSLGVRFNVAYDVVDKYPGLSPELKKKVIDESNKALRPEIIAFYDKLSIEVLNDKKLSSSDKVTKLINFIEHPALNNSDMKTALKKLEASSGKDPELRSVALEVMKLFNQNVVVALNDKIKLIQNDSEKAKLVTQRDDVKKYITTIDSYLEKLNRKMLKPGIVSIKIP